MENTEILTEDTFIDDIEIDEINKLNFDMFLDDEVEDVDEDGKQLLMRDLVEDFKTFEEKYGVDTHMIIEQLHDNNWYVEFKDEKKMFENYNEVREFLLNQS